MPKQHQIKLTITNNSGSDLTWSRDWFESGRRENGYEPDPLFNTIKDSRKLSIKFSEKDNAMNGCSGYVVYNLAGQDVSFAFSNPFVGKNKLAVGQGGKDVWDRMWAHPYNQDFNQRVIVNKEVYIARCKTTGGDLVADVTLENLKNVDQLQWQKNRDRIDFILHNPGSGQYTLKLDSMQNHYDWKYSSPTLGDQQIDLSDHQPVSAVFSTQIGGQTNGQLKAVSFNTHMFEGSIATIVQTLVANPGLVGLAGSAIKEIFPAAQELLFEDEIRANAIVNMVMQSDADIVLLTEVWAIAMQDRIKSSPLSAKYDVNDYLYKNGRGEGYQQSSGLMFLVKKDRGLALSDEQFTSYFNTQLPQDAVTYIKAVADGDWDKISRKGVFSAIVQDKNGFKFAVAASHCCTNPYRSEVNNIKAISDALKGARDAQLPCIVLGDLNQHWLRYNDDGSLAGEQDGYKNMMTDFAPSGLVDGFKTCVGRMINGSNDELPTPNTLSDKRWYSVNPVDNAITYHLW